jgi:hypothetical protein
MPDDRAPIQHIQNEASAITAQNAQMRDQIAKAIDILKAEMPDTFLGRKTHEPFPREDGEEQDL